MLSTRITRTVVNYHILWLLLYTVRKKTRHYTLVHSFAKYWPIFKLLSPSDSARNLQ